MSYFLENRRSIICLPVKFLIDRVLFITEFILWYHLLAVCLLNNDKATVRTSSDL